MGETYLFVVQHEDLMQSPYCPVIPEEGTFSLNALKLETLSTQISASKFQNLTKFHWKSVVFGKIVVFNLKLTQDFENSLNFLVNSSRG